MKKFIEIKKLNTFNEEKSFVFALEDVKYLREKHQGERRTFDKYTGEKTETELYPVTYELKLKNGESFLIYEESANILKAALLKGE